MSAAVFDFADINRRMNRKLPVATQLNTEAESVALLRAWLDANETAFSWAWDIPYVAPDSDPA